MRDFKSPKKQRKSPGHPASPQPSPEAAGEVACTEEGAGVQAPGAALETVTDAARAFRQLHVRQQPVLSGVEHSRARSPALQPRSPKKKRKATGRLDKEFILKDDKVKRNTDQQGDISQARGMLGQLLFEFGQLELNKDLLEAIKRTESRTGRQSRNGRRRHELDRIAFEYVVAEAAELLHSQLATVAAHTEDPGLQRALLRTYAVQAIATFTDEDYSSGEEDEDGEEEGAEEGYSSGGQDDRSPSPSPPQGALQHSGDALLLDPFAASQAEGALEGASPCCIRSQSVDMTTPLCHSPTRRPPEPWEQRQGQGQQGAGQREQRDPQQGQQAVQGQAQAWGSEQVSSSVLPDAPPDAALEDTAAQQPPQQAQRRLGSQGQQRAAMQTLRGGGSPQQAQRDLFALQHHQQQSLEELQEQLGAAVAGRSAGGPVQAQSSGLDDVMQQLSDAVDDMLRSPEAVTSRPRLPWVQPIHGLPQEGVTLAGLPPVQQLFGPPVPPGSEPPRRSRDLGGFGEAGVLGRQQQQEQQQVQQPVAEGGPEAAGHQPHHRLQYHPQRPLRAQRRQPQPLPALREEGSAREGGEAGLGVSPPSTRLLLRTVSPQHALPQPQHSSGGSGSGGTQQSSDAHTEALKRQRTDPDDAQQQALHRAQQAQQHDPTGATWPAGPTPDELQHVAPLSAHHVPPHEATSPLLEQQLPAGPAGQQPQQQSPGPGTAASPPQLGTGPPPRPGSEPAGPQQAGEAAGECEGSVEAQGAVAGHGSSAWGSTLVCADLTVNDVASKYWPFLRSAMQGQGAALREDDIVLVASLVKALGDTISGAYTTESGGRRPAPETKSLIAATAFDDMFCDKFAQESSGASK